MGTLILWIAARTGLSSLLSAVAAYALVAALAGGSLWGYGAWKYHAGKTAGIASERADWQERLRLAAVAKAAETKTRQADIDATAADYINRQRSDQATIAALEQALLREQKDLDNEPPDPAKPAGCRPAGIPAGVSTRLDAVGREPAAKAGGPR
ncbi:MAG: hypothetical protein EOQ64_18875 [Mesorhizobium sp.]|uniref:hypothetical protein n=2 Tax=Mesorhizobium sp. TaxID=1871066 RepID=UPI000FE4EC44|nr:hypothetical protein [Mesorhizobium sp.]RWG54849.1 MAG: hypothetical protein EOQ64_18875 [Mesorhizobium sp.]